MGANPHPSFFDNQMRIVTGTKPAGLAYPLSKVKDFLHVTGTDQDDQISSFINAAVDIIEHHTLEVLGSRTYTLYMDNWSTCVEIDKYPVSAISSVKYYDDDNNIQTLATSSYWSSLNDRALVYIQDQPTTYADRLDRIEIAFVAGYASWRAIPDNLVNTLCLIVADLYDNRSTVITGTVSNLVNSPAMKSMFMNYSRRVIR